MGNLTERDMQVLVKDIAASVPEFRIRILQTRKPATRLEAPKLRIDPSAHRYSRMDWEGFFRTRRSQIDLSTW